MTQQQLEYFLELAKTLNFTKVSQHFMISQTAVSKQIQNLEDEVGTKLFNRTSRQVELTNAGRTLMADAPNILASMYAAITRLQKTATGFTESLNAGYAKGLEKTEFYKILHSFTSDNPYIAVNMIRLNDFDSYTALDRREIDIAFCQQYKSKDSAYARIPLFSEYIICVIKSAHPLSFRDTVSFGDLENEQLLLTASSLATMAFSSEESYPNDSGPGTSLIPNHNNLRMDMLPYFPVDFKPRRIIWSNDMESCILMASMGMGIALVPSYAGFLNTFTGLRFIPLQNSEKLMHIQAVYRKDNMSEVLKKLLPYVEMHQNHIKNDP